MSYTSRVYRHRNAHTHENDSDNEQSSFFSKSDKQSASGKGHKPFFQAKLNVNQPGDKYEKEADAVANNVVNKKSDKPAIEEEKITGVQRLATSAADEKFSTDEERMKNDKEIQEKPEVQRKCSECEKEEEKGKETVQKKREENKEEKEKGAIQKKSDQEKEQERNPNTSLQRKEDGGGSSDGKSASPRLSSRISNSAGRGEKLGGKTLAEMQTGFGTDFSKVRIHTDAEAVDMNKKLNAQAFTHGNDIYFNSGKFNPETTAGKELLAHELTHVLQQQGYENRNAGASKNVQKVGPAVAVGAAVAAAVACSYAFYEYAITNYSAKGDKWMHCWTSCKMATWCGGSPVFAILMGAGKEVVDAIADSMGLHFHAEFADFVADFQGTFGCLALPCKWCCDSLYPQPEY